MEEAVERGYMEIVQYLRGDGNSDVNLWDYNSTLKVE